jgi:hypothetical protein
MSAAEARRRAINPWGDQYPDDDSTKVIVLQADGLEPENPEDRHVLLRWTNGIDEATRRFTQIIHLTGGPGNYSFHTPQVKIHSDTSLHSNTFHVLGEYTRAQRDQIIALARAVPFDKRSRVNNCQTWMRLLLEAMVNDNLLSRALFDQISADVPLLEPVPELSEAAT